MATAGLNKAGRIGPRKRVREDGEAGTADGGDPAPALKPGKAPFHQLLGQIPERPFELQIGINTGFCMVGTSGSEDRMDYTIIGTAVNGAPGSKLRVVGLP